MLELRSLSGSLASWLADDGALNNRAGLYLQVELHLISVILLLLLL